MKIQLKEITIRELTKGYEDNAEGGVIGYDGILDIRPPYQREFIYKDAQRVAVIRTVLKGFPLNVMYWATREDGTFEVIDGQQRTISISQYVKGDFSVDDMYFTNLPEDMKNQILDYALTIYQCTGTDSETLDWFRTINISGEKLTDQELRNAVYSGTWVSSAKKHFSKSTCPAHSIASQYLKGSAIRQDYLQTAISWISPNGIEEYMGINQHAPNANELWLNFQNVINWVEVTFPKYRKEMKGLPWGVYYNQFKDQSFDSDALEEEVAELMQDEDVTKKSGIYAYVLTRDEKYLSIRAFNPSQKREVYEAQDGFCASCAEHFEIGDMQADHIDPWSKGGKTNSDNCQMMCAPCNRRKSDK